MCMVALLLEHEHQYCLISIYLCTYIQCAVYKYYEVTVNC